MAFFFICSAQVSIFKDFVHKKVFKSFFLCKILNMAFYSAEFIKTLQKELQNKPRSKSFSTLAHVYYTEGEIAKAKSLCLEGLKYHPSYCAPHLLLADIYFTEKDFDQALKALNQAQALQPNNAKIYEKRAHIYTKQGLIEESLRAYKMLLVVRPDHQVALDYVSYLEKIVRPKAVVSVSSASSQEKLIKLNQILARVNNYIEQKGL